LVGVKRRLLDWANAGICVRMALHMRGVTTNVAPQCASVVVEFV